MALYRKLIKLPSFNAFSQSPEIVRIFERVLEREILPHPRNIARISFPRHYTNTTQPHQDFFYIRGTPETYTTWIPAVDCPTELGGLALLEGSHKLGFLAHEPAIGAGGNGVRTAKLGLRWLASPYEFGDFVLFHSHTVHGALDNHTPNRLRISLDYRYQRANDAIDPSSLNPHGG
jgi:ectoine hydroxylase-related dioxygenase (phytanoyl-CoA dioxygenase family)